jgi:hypothetical protein
MRRVKRLDDRLAGRLQQGLRRRLEQEKAQLLGSITAWQHQLQARDRPPHRSPFHQSPGWGVMTATLTCKRPYRSLRYV